MRSLTTETDVRAMRVSVEDSKLVVDLMDGRTIAVPLAWYPRLANATLQQRNHWGLAGGGYGTHWPEIDEDLSTAGLLRGAKAPETGGAGLMAPKVPMPAQHQQPLQEPRGARIQVPENRARPVGEPQQPHHEEQRPGQDDCDLCFGSRAKHSLKVSYLRFLHKRLRHF